MEPGSAHPPRDEERRLLALLEAAHAAERSAADLLSTPRHSVLHPAQKQFVDTHAGLRLKFPEAKLALREYRRKMHDGL